MQIKRTNKQANKTTEACEAHNEVHTHTHTCWTLKVADGSCQLGVSVCAAVCGWVLVGVCQGVCVCAVQAADGVCVDGGGIELSGWLWPCFASEQSHGSGLHLSVGTDAQRPQCVA